MLHDKDCEEMLFLVKKQLDNNAYRMMESIIKISLKLVLYNLSNKYSNENSYRNAVEHIQGNLVNFTALYVHQLISFSKGTNEGPFIDLFEELLNNNNKKAV